MTGDPILYSSASFIFIREQVPSPALSLALSVIEEHGFGSVHQLPENLQTSRYGIGPRCPHSGNC